MDLLSLVPTLCLRQHGGMKPPLPKGAGPPDRWLSQIEVQLRGQPRDVVAIAYLDAQEEMVALRVTAEGDAGASLLPLRDILRDVLDNDPASLVLAHNHPSGNPQPSQTDKRATQTLCAMLRPLGVNIADHIILAGDDRISFRDLRLL